MPSASPTSYTGTRLVCASLRHVSPSRINRSRDSVVSPATGVAFSATTFPSLVFALYKGCGPRCSVSRMEYAPILSIRLLVLEQDGGHIVRSAVCNRACNQCVDLRLQSSPLVQKFRNQRVAHRPIEPVRAKQNAVVRFELFHMRTNQNVIERAHRHRE